MEREENFKFLSYANTKASYETRTGVQGGPAKFVDKNGSIHVRNGFGNEKIFTPSTYCIYAADESGNVKRTDLGKNLIHHFGKLTPQKKENYVTNILTALVELGSCIGISNGGSKNFWIPDEELQNLTEVGEIFSNFSEFQDPFDFF